MQELWLPHPVRGMTTENWYVDPASGWARFLRNYIVRRGSVRMRGRQTIWESYSWAPSNESIIWHDVDLDHALFSDGKIYDVTDGSTTYTGTITSYPPYEGRFRDQIYLSYPGEAAIAKNAGTWGVWPYTLATLAATEIAGSTSHRGRSYHWGTDATDSSEQIEVSGLNSVTGNTTAYNFTHFLDGGTISFCLSLNVTPGINAEDVFCIFASNGVVLVFAGDDPGANNWFLLAKFTMTAPLSKHAWAYVQGDAFIMGLDYIYSVREMFSGGSKAAESNSITVPIQQLYKQAALRVSDYGGDPHPFGYFLEVENCLIFCMGFAADVMYSDDVARGLSAPSSWLEATNANYYRRLQIVYSRDTGAISLWDIPQWKWPISKQEDSDGDEYYIFGIEGTHMRYDWKGTHNKPGGSPAPFGQDALISDGSLTLSGGNSEDSGQLSKRVNIEAVWSTSILSNRAIRNALIKNIRPFLQQDTQLVITKCGTIGNGTDWQVGPYHGLFIRDTSAGDSFLGTHTDTGQSDKIMSPMINVGGNWHTVHATLRLNEMTEDTTTPNDGGNRWVDIYGMNLYFVPGGPR